MKFENPIINISMFEVENVVTSSGVEPPVSQDAQEATAKAAELGAAATITLAF